MGHVRLGELPRTWCWNQIIDLLQDGAGVGPIAEKTLEAAEQGFMRAAADKGLERVTWILSQLPDAARNEDYVSRLSDLGLDVTAPPTVIQLVGAFTDAVDVQMRRAGGRTDFGEMAQMAAAETLTSVLTAGSTTLWGTSTTDVQNALAAFGTEKQFGNLARQFFSRLTRRFLTFYLSRELSNHVGGARRFANVDAHAGFNAAIQEHCDQASKIVEQFSGQWWKKAKYEGGITPRKAGNFSAYALKKMRTEIRRGAVA